jgi:hypothetical protein
MDKYHTNKPPARDPRVNPATETQPVSIQANLNAADAAAASTADKYISPQGGAPVAPVEPAADPVPEVAAAPVAAPVAATDTPAPSVSALSALADAFATLPGEVNDMAAAALTRLNSAKAAAKSGVAKIHTVAAGIENTTKQIEDFARKVSNVPL